MIGKEDKVEEKEKQKAFFFFFFFTAFKRTRRRPWPFIQMNPAEIKGHFNKGTLKGFIYREVSLSYI